MRRLSLAIIWLAMAGCTIHEPTQVTLPVDPPPGYLEYRGDATPAVPAEPWWRAFQDQELNRLMQELFRQNLELTQMVARLDQVEALVRISRSARLPSVGADGRLSRSRQPGLNDDFIGNTEQLSLAAGFELER